MLLPTCICLLMHCDVEVRKQACGEAGTVSAGAGLQLSRRETNMSFNVFTRGPHSQELETGLGAH